MLIETSDKGTVFVLKLPAYDKNILKKDFARNTIITFLLMTVATIISFVLFYTPICHFRLEIIFAGDDFVNYCKCG